MTPLDDLKIAVVCGGPSAEADVSRVSGRGVADALRATFSRVVVLEFDERIVESVVASGADVVFPVLHGPPGEDGTFQGFLEVARLPYVGSGVHASACAMDKRVAKHLFRDRGLPVARDVIVFPGEDLARAAARAIKQLGPRVVVKPTRQGSALGVAFPQDPQELAKALADALAYGDPVLVEERIAGREITVGILERDVVEALPVTEIRTPQGSWYDYEHRYTPGFSEHVLPAELPAAQYARTQALAQLAHAALGCRDLSRVDFVVPEHGEPIVLEVNTLPGMTPTSLYPEAAQAAGVSFDALVRILVERAWSRRAEGSGGGS
ncbi:MAG TPA: D-alanine--D-alanine ligase [Gammaproteobacteria bacterium]